jgi:hypothetical protein
MVPTSSFEIMTDFYYPHTWFTGNQIGIQHRKPGMNTYATSKQD